MGKIGIIITLLYKVLGGLNNTYKGLVCGKYARTLAMITVILTSLL